MIAFPLPTPEDICLCDLCIMSKDLDESLDQIEELILQSQDDTTPLPVQ